MKKILITGTTNFIEFHLSNKILKKKYNILGIDKLNPCYLIKLKENFGYSPLAKIETGIKDIVKWFKNYYQK